MQGGELCGQPALMPPRKPLHNHPPPKQPNGRRPLHNHPPPKQPSRRKPAVHSQPQEQRRRVSPARSTKTRGPSAHRRHPFAEKQQARAELRAVRDALDGLAYHDKGGEVRFVGHRHGMASGVDLREAWAATTKMDELASSRDAKMEELEYAHARAVGNLSSAKERLVQASRRLATERAASGRTSATYRGNSPYRQSPLRSGKMSSQTTTTRAVDSAIDDALQGAKAALAAAGGDFQPAETNIFPRKRAPVSRQHKQSIWGPSPAEAVRGRAGSRVRNAEVAAQDAALRAREARRQLQKERTVAQQPMQELEEWLEVKPLTSPVAKATMLFSSAVDAHNQRTPEGPQALEQDATQPGQSVRPASQSIVSSGANASLGMNLRPRSSSPSSSGGGLRSKPRLSRNKSPAGGEVSSAVVWGSVRRHMTAVHTHRRRAAAAAVRKCPPVARRVLATALYRCPAVHPPTRTHSPNLRHKNKRRTRNNADGQVEQDTHPHEGRRISRSDFRTACADVMPRHTTLAHNLSSTTIDTLTEW